MQTAINTETEVANVALSYLGKTRITGIDQDTSPTGEQLRLHFARLRDTLQRKYNWVFCKAAASLPAVAGESYPGYARIFRLPKDCLAVRSLVGSPFESFQIINGNRLATNLSAPLQIKYTKSVPEVAYWDPVFQNVFALSLAAAIAPKLSDSDTLTTSLKQEAQAALKDALSSDAIKGDSEDTAADDWIRLANRALSLVAQDRGTSLNMTNSDAAYEVRLHFTDVRDSLQQGYPWNFCEKIVSLTANDGESYGRFPHVFDKPDDCLQVLDISNHPCAAFKVVSGGKIVTDAGDTIDLKYTACIADVSAWPAIFREVFASALAAKVAPKLTGSIQLAEQLKTDAELVLANAMASDAAEGTPDAFPETDWVTARY